MEGRATILVVDDDRAVGMVLTALLEQAGLEAIYRASGAEALEVLETRAVDMVVTDLRMPEIDGLSLLRQVQERWPEVPVAMLTAHGTVPVAVEAMKAGAADFLLKPFERDDILETVRRVLCRTERARNEPPRVDLGHELIGESAPMEALRNMLSRAAATSVTVLLQGESGTGKELAARAIHRASARRDGPLVTVNCAAIPDSLLESELFGHERGAFTGAVKRKPGRAELADGGTLFLDEIGDVPAAIQAKLLRLLQEKEIQPLGAEQTRKVDVRFVAATHRDLAALVAEGRFREDLFYRLNVLPIELPALRDRRDDIPLLARHFCEVLSTRHGMGERTFDESALGALRAQPWPGNVRELSSFVERLLILCPAERIGKVDVEQELSRTSATPGGIVDGDATLDERRRGAERTALRDALDRARGNRSLAARLLGISRRTLYNKLAEHALS